MVAGGEGGVWQAASGVWGVRAVSVLIRSREGLVCGGGLWEGLDIVCKLARRVLEKCP